ncbi:hypothetical protein GCM10027456_56850 [Kineosporia babensis]
MSHLAQLAPPLLAPKPGQVRRRASGGDDNLVLLKGRHSCRPHGRGGTLMKKLLMVAIASVAGVAVWRKVGATKPTQPWASATDKV